MVYAMVTVIAVLLFLFTEVRLWHWQAEAHGGGRGRGRGVRFSYPWLRATGWTPISCSSVQLIRMTLIYAIAAGMLAAWSSLYFESLAVLFQAYLRDSELFPLDLNSVVGYILGTVVTMILHTRVLTRALCFDCLSPALSQIRAYALLSTYLVAFYTGAVGLAAIHFGTFHYLCYLWPLIVFIIALVCAWLGVCLLLAAARREYDHVVVVPYVLQVPAPLPCPPVPLPAPLPPPPPLPLPPPPLPRPPPPLPLPPPPPAGLYGESAFMRAFRQADENHDGELEKHEFATLLSLVGPPPASVDQEAGQSGTSGLDPRSPAPSAAVPNYSFYGQNILHAAPAAFSGLAPTSANASAVPSPGQMCTRDQRG